MLFGLLWDVVLSIRCMVLILIVMEDVLWANASDRPTDYTASLNPYCNGRCSLGISQRACRGRCGRVLILIVMEDVLWDNRFAEYKEKLRGVLILIVMEDVLWVHEDTIIKIIEKLS